MNPINNETLTWYNNHAQEYINRTKHANTNLAMEKFIQKLPTTKTLHILDLGCGSGKDSKKFLDMGFEVTALDGSPEIAALASQYIKKPVLVQTLPNIRLRQEFDGIWAMASLLHLNDGDFIESILKTSDYLKPGGCFYISLKLGEGHITSPEGRYFNFFTVEKIERMLKEFQIKLRIDEVFTSDSVLGTGEKWLNLYLKN